MGFRAIVMFIGSFMGDVTYLKDIEVCMQSTICCIRCGPDEERILDIVPMEDGARNSG